jgi:hypothetical protein
MLRTSASILFLLGLSISVLAQRPEPTASTEKSETGTISGRVVNENGGPIANALVYARLGNEPNSKISYTDQQGVFRIGDLEPGEYAMSARAAAYITPPPDRTGRYRNPNARPGDTVTLTLLKGGVITGKVIDATGQPVVWASVSAVIIGDDDGRVYPSGFRSGIENPTDDRGIYRIYGLQPGTYVVSAGGKSDLSRGTTFINAYDDDIATYAPSSYREDAAEIKVRVGEEATADIRYRAEQGRTVSGEVRVPPKTGTGFSVVLAVAGEGELRWQSEYHSTTDTQKFVFKGVRDGDYEVFAHSWTGSGERSGSEAKRISVKGADVEGVVLSPQPFASIAGRLVIEPPTIAACPEKDLLPFQQVDVVPTHNETAAARRTPQAIWDMGRSERAGPDGSFLLQRLAAGEYMFSTRTNWRSWYLRSIVLVPLAAPGAKVAPRPVDAARVWTTLKPGDKVSGLTVTLAHGAAFLRGQLVAGEGETFPPRMVVYLVPADGERADDVLRYFASQVYDEKNFGFDNVPPGRYWIVAQSQPEGVASPLSQLRYPHETLMRSRLRREAEALKNEIEFKPCQEVGDFKLPLKPAIQ